MSDVKELIVSVLPSKKLIFRRVASLHLHIACAASVTIIQPEMFCCPEALINTNKLPLGKLQDTAQVVDDVVLPPWARGDPFEFVRLNREALESDYVSEVSMNMCMVYLHTCTGSVCMEWLAVEYVIMWNLSPSQCRHILL
jgi:hypothetical protein